MDGIQNTLFTAVLKHAFEFIITFMASEAILFEKYEVIGIVNLEVRKCTSICKGVLSNFYFVYRG